MTGVKRTNDNLSAASSATTSSDSAGTVDSSNMDVQQSSNPAPRYHRSLKTLKDADGKSQSSQGSMPISSIVVDCSNVSNVYIIISKKYIVFTERSSYATKMNYNVGTNWICTYLINNQ